MRGNSERRTTTNSPTSDSPGSNSTGTGSSATNSLATAFAADDRGQTLNDYALGISVFLLTVAFVVSFVPTIFTPFTAPIDDATTAQADRSAAFLVNSLSTDDRPSVLDVERTESFFENEDAASDLQTYLGLSATTRVNVTMTDPTTNAVAAVGPSGERAIAGRQLRDGPMAASTRIVVVNGTTYQLTARIW